MMTMIMMMMMMIWWWWWWWWGGGGGGMMMMLMRRRRRTRTRTMTMTMTTTMRYSNLVHKMFLVLQVFLVWFLATPWSISEIRNFAVELEHLHIAFLKIAVADFTPFCLCVLSPYPRMSSQAPWTRWCWVQLKWTTFAASFSHRWPGVGRTQRECLLGLLTKNPVLGASKHSSRHWYPWGQHGQWFCRARWQRDDELKCSLGVHAVVLCVLGRGGQTANRLPCLTAFSSRSGNPGRTSAGRFFSLITFYMCWPWSLQHTAWIGIGQVNSSESLYYGGCCDGSAEGGDSDGDGCGGDDNH